MKVFEVTATFTVETENTAQAARLALDSLGNYTITGFQLAESWRQNPVAGPLIQTGVDGPEVSFTAEAQSAPEVVLETTAEGPVDPAEPEGGTTAPKVAPRAMAKARELAKEHGIDWKTLHPGSGRAGMITQSDVREAVKVKNAKAKAETPRAEPGTGPVTFAALRSRLSLLVQAQGKDKAREFLQRFDVDRISALPEAKYAEVYEALVEAVG